MLASMTGFGRSSIVVNGNNFEFEARCFNNRFFELSLKLPPALLTREFEIRELIRDQISRGKLYFSCSMTFGTEKNQEINYNAEKVGAVINMLERVKNDFNLQSDVKLSHLLSIRDLFNADETMLDDESFESIKGGIEAALIELQTMQHMEGTVLLNDLSHRIGLIEDALRAITKNIAENTKSYLDRYRKRVLELIQNISSQSDRLEMELAVLAERSDITEECVRLQSHIDYFRTTLMQDDPGKRLNFLCQEIQREANTISAKSIASEITYLAIRIKEEIERIREQVQNIG